MFFKVYVLDIYIYNDLSRTFTSIATIALLNLRAAPIFKKMPINTPYLRIHLFFITDITIPVSWCTVEAEIHDTIYF